VQQAGSAGGVAENRHTLLAGSDFLASLDRLELPAPNVKSVMLVVPRFGTDLRCGHCQIRPMVDTGSKTTAPYEWTVSGLSRATAPLVSFVDGSASAGGTPRMRRSRVASLINAHIVCPWLHWPRKRTGAD
jgi:hypothetical protein